MAHQRIIRLLVLLLLSQFVLAQRGMVDYNWRQDAVVWGGNVTYYATGDEAERSRVHLNLLETGRDRVIWDGNAPISRISFSPSGQAVAFVEHYLELDVDPFRATFYDRSVDAQGKEILKHHYENQLLRLISIEGESLESMDQVRVYDWSPDGDAVTYITGLYREGGGGSIGTVLWLYTLGTDEPVKLHTRDGLMDVEWAIFDGRIYARSAVTEVVAIDPTDRSVEPSEYVGARFLRNPAHRDHRFRSKLITDSGPT